MTFWKRRRSKADGAPLFVPPGHFYSPVVDPDSLSARRDSVWPDAPECLGLDFNAAGQQRLLEEAVARYLPEFDYPADGPGDDELDHFYVNNSQFSHLDCRALYCFLRHWRPSRLIEVGCGYSTLLSADVNRRYLDGAMHLSCIEPYPRPFLKRGIDGLSEVIERKVEDVPLALFGSLRRGDVLFIDSSHVAKTGSDVLYLFFEVLPRLASGVRVHVHDIFLPNDYPADWVLTENRSWNEQYLLRALLTGNPRYRVLFGSSFAYERLHDDLARAFAASGAAPMSGGSFWFEVV